MGVNVAAIRIFWFRPPAGHRRQWLADIVVPALGFLFCFWIWWSLPKPAQVIGGIWFVIGGRLYCDPDPRISPAPRNARLPRFLSWGPSWLQELGGVLTVPFQGEAAMKSVAVMFVGLLLPAGLAIATAAEDGGPPPQKKWKLVFSDEFEGTTLDATKWTKSQSSKALHWQGTPSEEDDANGGLDGHGNLVLKMTKDEKGVYRYHNGFDTRGKHLQTYGYFETRVRFTKEPGVVGRRMALWKPGRNQSVPLRAGDRHLRGLLQAQDEERSPALRPHRRHVGRPCRSRQRTQKGCKETPSPAFPNR